MECRVGCAACCIIPSISSPMPKMKEGKKAGVRCLHLTDDNKCELFGKPERPDVCGGFKAEKLFCGDNKEQAFKILAGLEGVSNWQDLLR
ncbi:YkgJ family cysteine cluster protein [Plebeiibacterium sediminum]|uniref:YkgJ family cysteine cluster protein n=1 Tax=Plebeiibacterium sediminum TaxID=2992112 RepID=A0AAE3M814_9BACT|nr:YkgJ family cysteine cluster protein [Plebeiobacterium sediminum]MCW3788691.1 YkgJ family cysteine cluster protein [Plebeiobacterium sediminum]